MRVAAVDIGTNSVRLLVAEPTPEGRLGCLDRRVRVVRLGEEVDASGRLTRPAVERALGVLEAYGEAIRHHRVERVRAVATSAVRQAANRGEFLGEAARVLGTRPEVISGEEEARLSFRGATLGLADEPAPFLVVDLGGGSTEFVYGSAEPDYLVSIDMGSVRLTERCLRDRPAPPEQLEEARRVVGAALAGVDLPGPPGTCVGLAGTFTSLAAIHLQLPAYDPGRVHRARLSLADLDRLADRLATLTVEETAAIPALDPARAPVLLAGAVLAEEAVGLARTGSVVVSESDILDGVAAGLAL